MLVFDVELISYRDVDAAAAAGRATFVGRSRRRRAPPRPRGAAPPAPALGLSRPACSGSSPRGRVLVNGRRGRAGRPSACAPATWCRRRAGRRRRRSRPPPSRCHSNVYEDDDLLVRRARPPGMVAHPSYGRVGHAPERRARHAARDGPGVAAALVQRLDKGTSGPAARRQVARRACGAAAPRDASSRTTWRWCWGRPLAARGAHRPALGRDPLDRRRVMVRDGGAAALTALSTCWPARAARRAAQPRALPARDRDAPTNSACIWPARAGRSSATRSTATAAPAPGRHRACDRPARPFRPPGAARVAAAIRAPASRRTAVASSRRCRDDLAGVPPRRAAALPGCARSAADCIRRVRQNRRGRDRPRPMTAHDLSAASRAQPRTRLAALPTPLQDATRCATRWAARRAARASSSSATTSPASALGGNKARKLEFLVGDALREGADDAHHDRRRAVEPRAHDGGGGARRRPRRRDLVLTAHAADPPLEGNLLLDRLFGARVHFVPAIGSDARRRPRRSDGAPRWPRADAARRRPYVIPVGGSSADRRARLRGRHAGAGRAARRARRRTVAALFRQRVARHAGRTDARRALCGGAVRAARRGRERRRAREDRAGAARGREAAALLGADDSVLGVRFVTDQRYIGEGYGLPTPAGLEPCCCWRAPRRSCSTRTYTSKAMAALVRDVRAGRLRRDETVVFLHTGGRPAIFTAAAARSSGARRDGRFRNDFAVRRVQKLSTLYPNGTDRHLTRRMHNDLAHRSVALAGPLSQDVPVRARQSAALRRDCATSCSGGRPRPANRSAILAIVVPV